MSAKNPFNVVKATEYSDLEIQQYWVDYKTTDKSNSLDMKLHPQELMPKYILGSKGCGKTHILRYYSFPLRSVKYENNIRELLATDKYIGVYSRLDSLNSSRFEGKEVSHDVWNSLYDYYFELYQSIIVLQCYQKIFDLLDVSKSQEGHIVQCIADAIQVELDRYDIASLIFHFNKLRVAIDRQIIDYAYKRSIDWECVKPIFKFGDVIFEIPRIIHHNIEELNDVNLIYILDEYEKLNDWQKRSLNSLVYEKKWNVTFWIGARKYGYTTRETKMAEPIKEGHEFQPVILDEWIRDKKAFKRFANEVFINRLKVAKIEGITSSIFEEFHEKKLIDKLNEKRTSFKHWEQLKESLRSINVSEKDIENIITGLASGAESNPLHQKYKLFSFYQLWAKNKNKKGLNTYGILEKATIEVQQEFEAYLKGVKNSFKGRVQKFKTDFLAQLAIENGLKYHLYSGFDELVNIADYNPRVFLTMVKLIVDESIIKGKNPFEDTSVRISANSQYVGVNEAAKWFMRDVEVVGKDKERLDVVINNLIKFFYTNRFCNKPTETSPCSFYYKTSMRVSESEKIIKIAENESFLIEVHNKRKDKTLGTPERTYQLNKTIATLYNLPTARRGVVKLSPDMLLSIFDESYFDNFDSNLKRLRLKLNAPFMQPEDKIKTTDISHPTLFD